MKILNIASGFFLLLMLCCCNQETGDSIESGFIKTIPGGCNNMKSAELKHVTVEERDTVTFRLIKDTLVMFTGINYVCCAPFQTTAILRNDSLVITLDDTCILQQQNCYCKCMCYYTWEFLFAGFQKGKIKGYKVILDDPRQKEPFLLMQGSLKF